MYTSKHLFARIYFVLVLLFTACQQPTQIRPLTDASDRRVQQNLPDKLTELELQAPAAPVMFAHYVDVGQGACALFEFPCGAILVDTGGDGDAHVASLINYLETFFARRTDLNRTLASIVITHPHADHTKGLRRVVETFNVARYIDDGRTSGSGWLDEKWVREQSGAHQPHVIRSIQDTAFSGAAAHTGITDGDIDPLVCARCDPKVTILSGGFAAKPMGWSAADYDNQNNHSIVVRIDFGRASFLVTGDLELQGIAHLITQYRDTTMLDVDVYTVGHHGAENGTTADLLRFVTPKIAVINVGKSTDGAGSRSIFTTYAYGHPRLAILDLLAASTLGTRQTSETVQAATGARQFTSYVVSKQIYATGWEGTLIVSATLDGTYQVTPANAAHVTSSTVPAESFARR